MYHWSGRVPRAGSSRRDGASTGACLLRYQVELAALRRPTVTIVSTIAMTDDAFSVRRAKELVEQKGFAEF